MSLSLLFSETAFVSCYNPDFRGTMGSDLSLPDFTHAAPAPDGVGIAA